MSNSNQKPVSTQQAYQIGQNGGTVNTNGMTHQNANRIDAAVNAGRQDSANSGKQGK